MRRTFTFVGVLVMLVGAMALPAAADDPIFESGSDTFDFPNPCSGELDTFTINFASDPGLAGWLVQGGTELDGSLRDLTGLSAISERSPLHAS